MQRAGALVGAQNLRPEIFVAAGNYRGLFRDLASGGLGVKGVRVTAPDASFRDHPETIPSDVRDKLVTVLGSAVGLLNPVAGMLVAVADLGATLVRKWRETPVQDLQPHAILIDTLRAATSAGPTVLLFEDITGGDREVIWQTLLYHVTRMPDRRLLVVVGADGPPSLERHNDHDPLEGFAPVLQQVRSAVAVKRASWWWLAPLDLRRVTAWVGAVDSDVGHRLIAVSGGDDEIAAHNWQNWITEGYVRKDRTGRWTSTGIDDPLEVNIFDVLVTRLRDTDIVPASIDALGLARQALEYAALSGVSFSLTAVCLVLSSDRSVVTAEQIEELADLLTPAPGKPWLIDTCEHTQIPVGEESTWHWLYRFVSADLAAFLKANWSIANEPDQQSITALNLIQAVREAHRDDPLFYKCCYELATTAGDSQEAGKYAERIAAVARRQQLTVRVQLLLNLPYDDELALGQLVTTTRELLMDGQLSLSKRVGARSYAMANRIGNTSQKAAASSSYGRTLNWSGQQAQAIPLLEEAVRLRRVRAESNLVSATDQKEYAVALSDAGVAYRDLGKTQEAIHSLEEAVSAFRELLLPTPGNVEYRRLLAIQLQSLGQAYGHGGRTREAIESLDEAIRLFRGLLDSDPTSPVYKRDLGIALGDLGSVYISMDQANEAIGPSEEAVLFLRGLLDSDPNNADYQRQLAVRLNDQGTAYSKVGRVNEAAEPLEEAVALRQALFDSDSANVARQYDLAFSLGSLGVAYRQVGRTPESIELSQEAILLYHRLVSSDPTNATYQRGLAIRLGDLGVAFWVARQWQASNRSFEEAIALLQRLVQSDPESADYRQILAQTSKASEAASRTRY